MKNKTAKQQLSELYNKICATLTDFENCTDPETTDKEWLDEFYSLLVLTQNSIDTLEE